jgi:hypothetical protein
LWEENKERAERIADKWYHGRCFYTQLAKNHPLSWKFDRRKYWQFALGFGIMVNNSVFQPVTAVNSSEMAGFLFIGD